MNFTWLIICVLVAAVGAIATLWYRGRALRAEGKVATQTVELEGHQREYAALNIELATLKQGFAGDRARMERVIDGMRLEAQELQKDLELCKDPAAIRERLQRLLTGTPA